MKLVKFSQDAGKCRFVFSKEHTSVSNAVDGAEILLSADTLFNVLVKSFNNGMGGEIQIIPGMVGVDNTEQK